MHWNRHVGPILAFVAVLATPLAAQNGSIRGQVVDSVTRQGLAGATVQIVQQTDLVTIISVLALIVDTVGDFTFISLYTSSIFLIFAYAVTLYALSTLGFVRSIEYLWAGFAAMYGGNTKKAA